MSGVARAHLMVGDDEALEVDVDDDLDGIHLRLSTQGARQHRRTGFDVTVAVSFDPTEDQTPTERLLEWARELVADLETRAVERLAAEEKAMTANHPSRGAPAGLCAVPESSS